jgi:starch synthase
LESLIQARQSHLAGVLNGIDTLRWNPQTGRHIVESYTTDTLEKRTANKLALQRKLGLPEREDVPLIATVIRLVDQKGPQILFPAIWNMLNHRDIQFVLLGSGFYSFENEAWLIGDRFKDKTSITLTFDEALSEMIYAAADIFVMPSLFEPCGIGQMLAMRYGAIPVVREVGGLVDTVPRETGFLFRDFHQSALEWSLGEAIHVYVTDPEGWQERQRRAMNIDFGWDRSAQQYIELYQRTLRVHRNYQSSSN